jgi:hypothetical protein
VSTDENGSFVTAQEVPDWAELNRVHYFFASYDDEIPVALSSAFHVTAANGVARVTGTIGERTEGCVDLRDAQDELYHLQGDVASASRAIASRWRGRSRIPPRAVDVGIVIAVSDFRVLPR